MKLRSFTLFLMVLISLSAPFLALGEVPKMAYGTWSLESAKCEGRWSPEDFWIDELASFGRPDVELSIGKEKTTLTETDSSLCSSTYTGTFDSKSAATFFKQESDSHTCQVFSEILKTTGYLDGEMFLSVSPNGFELWIHRYDLSQGCKTHVQHYTRRGTS